MTIEYCFDIKHEKYFWIGDLGIGGIAPIEVSKPGANMAMIAKTRC